MGEKAAGRGYSQRDSPSRAGEGPGPATPPQPARVGTVRTPVAMEVKPVPSSTPDRLTDDQKEVWDLMRPHLSEPSGDQAPQHAVNLGIHSFLYWCDFDGLRPLPSEAAIRAEFEAAGVPERFPSEDFWEHLRENPGYPWILAPRGRSAWGR